VVFFPIDPAGSNFITFWDNKIQTTRAKASFQLVTDLCGDQARLQDRKFGILPDGYTTKAIEFILVFVITRFWSNQEVGRKRDGLGRLHVEDL
jgi:hypothetical protein